MKHLPVLLMLFLPAFQAVSQEIARTDTLPPAIKEDVRGGQKTLSERLVVPKDFSVMATPTGEADFIKFVQALPGVYNVLNRHNPFSLSFDPDKDEWIPIISSLKCIISL